MKNKTKSKILSFMLLSAVILGCKQPTTPTPEQPIIVEEEKGIANWNNFKSIAGKDFTTIIDNFNEIKGFSGYALYSDIEKFFSSSYFENNDKRYDTKNLKIFFDTYGIDNSDVNNPINYEAITPSTLENIYKKFTHINITNENQTTGSLEYIKISSGSDNEVYDINKFYNRFINNELNITGIISQPTDEETIIGIDDNYLNSILTTDINKLKYVLNNPFFANATIGKVKLTGNISGVEELYLKERALRNITFDKTAYSKAKDGTMDTLTLSQIKERNVRGFLTNITNATIKGDGFMQDESSPLNFDYAILDNVVFTNDTDLSEVSFNKVNSKNSLIFQGTLPSDMQGFTGDKIIFDNAKISNYTEQADGSITGGLNISNMIANSLKINGTLVNKENITSTSKGILNFYDGDKQTYDILKELLIIKDANINIDIVKLLLQQRTKEYV